MSDIVQLTICRDPDNGYDVNALGLADRREAVIDSSERIDFFRDLLDLTTEKAAQFGSYLSIQVSISADNWANWLAGYEIVDDVDPEYVAAYLST
ncbi:hypothetical protein BH23CYA1_BH23CYA1_13690 [soil metagenome]